MCPKRARAGGGTNWLCTFIQVLRRVSTLIFHEIERAHRIATQNSMLFRSPSGARVETERSELGHIVLMAHASSFRVDDFNSKRDLWKLPYI